MILLLFGISFLIQTTSCTPYNPLNFPVYDVLRPSAEVTDNPHGYITVLDGVVTEITWINDVMSDGEFTIVDEDFMQWVYELKLTIKEMK